MGARVLINGNWYQSSAAYGRGSGWRGKSGCGRPKSGADESWPISTMARRIARVRLNWLNNVSPSPRRIARVNVARSSLKRPSISSTASLFARKTSRHMVGSEVVMLGRHDLDIRAEQSPERHEPLDRGRLDVRRRRENAPAVDEQLGKAGIWAGVFSAGDGMGRHEMHPRGKMGRHGAQYRGFDRADIGDDRPRRKVRPDLRGHRAASADRDGDNDEIGAFGCGCVGCDHVIGEAEFGKAPARGGGAGGGDDGTRSALRARGTRDRGTDETHSDQRKAIENGLPLHLRPTNSASAATTRRFASSLPTVIRSAFGSL